MHEPRKTEEHATAESMQILCCRTFPRRINVYPVMAKRALAPFRQAFRRGSDATERDSMGRERATFCLPRASGARRENRAAEPARKAGGKIFRPSSGKSATEAAHPRRKRASRW